MWTIFRSAALIGSSSTRAPGADGLLGAPQRERLERPAAAVAVAGRVDDDLAALLAGAAGDRGGEHLDGVDRLPVPADQEPEVVAEAGRGERLVRLLDLDPAADADRGGDVLEQRRAAGAAASLSSSAAASRRGAGLGGASRARAPGV